MTGQPRRSSLLFLTALLVAAHSGRFALASTDAVDAVARPLASSSVPEQKVTNDDAAEILPAEDHPRRELFWSLIFLGM